MWTMTLLLLAGALAFYYYCVRHLTKFKKAGIPCVPGLPIIGSMSKALFRRKPLAHVIDDAYKYNPKAKYIGAFDLLQPVVIIRDPELIKAIAVKNFDSFPNHRGFVDESDELFGQNLIALRDDKWRDTRNILSPAFTSSKMKSMFKLMVACADDFTQCMLDLPEEKRVMEMKDALMKYTVDIIATCAFGISVNSMKDPQNEFYVYGIEMTNFPVTRMIKFILARALPKVCRVLGIKLFDDKYGQFFKKVVQDTIRTRDEKGIHRPDMIQLMMETRGKGEGKELSISQMTSQAFIFFFGGFDSTSSTMAFVTYELAVNPDVQERLQRDIDAALEESNGEVTYEMVNNMKLLEAVISETLRMWPLGAFLDRECSKRFELPPSLPGLKPYVVEKGENVWFPAFGLHRDPQHFENPTTFNPDRFIEKTGDNMDAYVPFGIGPRMCIGNRFALLEIKVLLFKLLAKCTIKTCEKTQIPMLLDKSGFTMKAEGGFWLKIEARNK